MLPCQRCSHHLLYLPNFLIKQEVWKVTKWYSLLLEGPGCSKEQLITSQVKETQQDKLSNGVWCFPWHSKSSELPLVFWKPGASKSHTSNTLKWKTSSWSSTNGCKRKGFSCYHLCLISLVMKESTVCAEKVSVRGFLRKTFWSF